MLRRCVFALAYLLAAGLLQPLMACTCEGMKQPCGYWGVTDAIFLGRVVDISSFEVSRKDPFPHKETLVRVRFEVESGFHGVAVGTIEIESDISTCSYGFELNRRYVVYAYRDGSGSLGTSMCTRTRRVENAEEDLAFFRGLATAPPGGSVLGQLVFRESVSLLSKVRFAPVVGATVIVEGPGGPWKAVSDANGRYQIAGLPPGRYEVKPQTAVGSATQFKSLSTEVTLREHACAEVNGYAEVSGRISGFVSDADGRPVPHVPVELLPESMSPLDRRTISLPRTYTTEDGSYELKALPSGRYLILVHLMSEPRPIMEGRAAYPRTYYPATAERSEARVIELAAGAELRGVDIKLPSPLRKREIHGVVVWSDGKKAKGAVVNLRNPEYLPGSSTFSEADADGAFSISAFEGQPYRIVASSSIGPDGTPLRNKVSSLPTVVGDEQAVVTLPYPATLRGRMVDALGRPLANISLNLVAEEARSLEEALHLPYLYATSDAQGRFEITGLDPRRYVLGVRPFSPPYPSQDAEYAPTFYPGTGDRNLAAVIELKEGEKTELRDFVLPEKLKEVAIEGIVTWPDGRPVQRGYVGAHDSEFPESSVVSMEVGADGRFKFQLFMGRRYEVYATTSTDREGRQSIWHYEVRHGEMTIDSSVQGLTLRMSEKP